VTLEAPAIADARAPRPDVGPQLVTWLRGIGARQVRIACGLVMFAYIFSHFFNHALGNISYEAMETWLAWHIRWWRNPVVNATLYTAAVVHFALGLWALYQRRHFRYAGAEIAQLVLGLSIPLWLAGHFGAVRLSGLFYGLAPPNYASTLFTYWALRPDLLAVQFALLTIAWAHACIGLYFWLRMKSFFAWASPILFAVAVLLPVLAVIGTHHSAREVISLAQDADWRKENFRGMSAAQSQVIGDTVYFYFPIGYAGAIALVFAARGLRTWRERRRGIITIAYPERKVRVPKGLSVLEASLRFHVPHASVCGGRARCSTCRVRVVGNPHALPPPSGREAFVLQRIGVSGNPAIRLACQLRPLTDVAVFPILPPHMNADMLRKGQSMNVGKERYVVSMFVDMRGSTKMAEARLPFDVVFLINRFLGAISQAVLAAGGQPNQFVGDGLLALFGLDTDPKTASRQALRAAANIVANVEEMNRQFAPDLRQPIQFGVGIHGGDVIVGDIGFKEHTVFTALGDPVNVAARLQDMTKTLDCQVVVSEEVYAKAGLSPAALPRSEVAIRGRAEPMHVRTVVDPAVLATLLETPAPQRHPATA
jgi:adenylate cyclase